MTIILAEDDDGHAALVERNLLRAGFLNTLLRVRDGQEAIDLLRGENDFAGKAPGHPVLLILDINMPRLDGLEALRVIRKDPKLSTIPVIMLTTTDDPREIERCYREGCNVYVSKPVAYEAFIEAVRRLGLFLEVVQLPTNPAT